MENNENQIPTAAPMPTDLGAYKEENKHKRHAILLLLLLLLLSFAIGATYLSRGDGYRTAITGPCDGVLTASAKLGSDMDCSDAKRALTVRGDNITLDCDGYKIIGGKSGLGIVVEVSSGVTLKNCDVAGFKYGILANESQNVVIETSTTTGNYYGVGLNKSSGKISNSNVSSNQTGLYALFSQGYVSNSNISNNAQYGVYTEGDTTDIKSSTACNNGLSDLFASDKPITIEETACDLSCNSDCKQTCPK
jgi:hypothetical protein